MKAEKGRSTKKRQNKSLGLGLFPFINQKQLKQHKREIKKQLKKRQKSFKRRLERINKPVYAGLILIVVGLAVGGVSLFGVWQAQHSALPPSRGPALKNNQPVKNAQPLIAGTPVRIQIPSVAIDLKVIPGYYYPTTNSWTLSLTNAQYGVMTAKANNKGGDTFIYAHARVGDFYTLPQIQPGAKAVITTKNGHTFTYTFSHSTVTSPSDTSLFNYKGEPILVLQTCTGLWYQDRQLFMFNLEKAV